MGKISIILSIIFFLLSGSVSARFKVGPSTMELSLQPGTSQQKEIYLENLSDKPVKLIVSVQTFRNSRNNSKLQWTDWLAIKTETVNLKGKEKRLLKYTLKAPVDFKGEVSAKVSFLEKGDDNSMIHPKVSMAIYLIAKNNALLGAELSKLEIKKNNEFLSFQLLIKNTGDIHIRPEGYLNIFNTQDHLISKIKFEKIYPVFENHVGILYNNKDNRLADGEYTGKAEIILGYNNSYQIKKNYKIIIENNNVTIKDM